MRVENNGYSHTLLQYIQLVTTFKKNLYIIYQSAKATTKVYKNSYARMFMTLLIITAKIRKQLDIVSRKVINLISLYI